MLNCQHASQLISQSLDRRLLWSERLQLRLHLMFCDVCTRFRQQLQQLRQAAARLRHYIDSDERIQLAEASKQRIMRAMQQAADAEQSK